MSVHVTVMPATIPHHLRDEDITRMMPYEDREDAEYVFGVLASGALAVWTREPGSVTPSELAVVYGPASWESVQGTPQIPLK